MLHQIADRGTDNPREVDDCVELRVLVLLVMNEPDGVPDQQSEQSSLPNEKKIRHAKLPCERTVHPTAGVKMTNKNIIKWNFCQPSLELKTSNEKILREAGFVRWSG